jgi:hypothetical protein
MRAVPIAVVEIDRIERDDADFFVSHLPLLFNEPYNGGSAVRQG